MHTLQLLTSIRNEIYYCWGQFLIAVLERKKDITAKSHLGGQNQIDET